MPPAGQGARTGMSVPKQFWLIEGLPLFIYSLKALLAYHALAGVVIPVPPGYENAAGCWVRQAGLTKPPVRVVTGGASRLLSILEGVRVLPSCDVVIVHDGARPLVSAGLLEKVSNAAMKYGAAGTVARLVDTIVTPRAGFLAAFHGRNGLMISQTPKAFRQPVLQRALAEAFRDELLTGADLLELVMRTGCPIRLIEGAPDSFKVTYSHELRFVELQLKDRGSSSGHSAHDL